MTWRIVPLADVPPSPWRNGGGTTRELLAWPNAQDWQWRLSVAEVRQSGPFSRYDGVQRWFAVLSGAGVWLTLGHPKESPALPQCVNLTSRSAPFCFDGARPADCQLLGGPTQDFNLMLRPGQTSALMRRVSGSLSALMDTPKIIAVYAINTGARARFDSKFTRIPESSLAWLAAPAGTVLALEAANALWMEIDTCL
jgi:environmental stress-induced protein Ves